MNALFPFTIVIYALRFIEVMPFALSNAIASVPSANIYVFRVFLRLFIISGFPRFFSNSTRLTPDKNVDPSSNIFFL